MSEIPKSNKRFVYRTVNSLTSLYRLKYRHKHELIHENNIIPKNAKVILTIPNSPNEVLSKCRVKIGVFIKPIPIGIKEPKKYHRKSFLNVVPLNDLSTCI